MGAAALVLHCVNDYSSGACLATGGLKTAALQAGQLAGTPSRPLCQMAITWRKMQNNKQINITTAWSSIISILSYVKLILILLPTIRSTEKFKWNQKQLQHSSVAHYVPNAKKQITGYCLHCETPKSNVKAMKITGTGLPGEKIICLTKAGWCFRCVSQ